MVASVLVSGCVATQDGHLSAGMPTKDKLVSRYERTIPQLQAATRAVLTRNGKLLMDDSVGNVIKAKVNERDVWVKLEAVDPKVTQVTVQCRSNVGGDIEWTAEISKQIAVQLAVSQ